LRPGFSSEAGLPVLSIERKDGLAHFQNRPGRPAATVDRPMAWTYLFFAGIFEIGWAIGLKYTDGFTRPAPTAWTVISMIASLGLLGLALKSLPVGTAYAVWTGIGTIGTALLGIWLLGEPATALRLACIALIVAGIAGLKLVS
jgi:quaternary ammonium compound-resistance protein SugE